jgi:hypothetical protein
MPGPFVGWRFKDSHFSGPMPSYTYAPLRRAGLVRVFELEAQPAEQAAAATQRPDPAFLNIFLDQDRVSPDAFAAMADCLARHRDALNGALQRRASYIPWPSERFYHPLRPDGIAFGRPPYTDGACMDAVAGLHGAAIIPDQGAFLVYPGHPPHGIINTHTVEIGLDGTGEITLKLDDEPVAFDKNGQGSKPGVARYWWGRMFDGDICQRRHQLWRAYRNNGATGRRRRPFHGLSQGWAECLPIGM